MAYDTVATFSQVSSLLLFIALFVVVVVYVLMPQTRDRLERAQRRALDLDSKHNHEDGR